MANELAKRAKMEISEDVLELYKQDTGVGMEDAPTGGGSPFSSLLVLQAQSPQVRDGLATMGDVGRLFHTGTKQITNEEIICICKVIPAWIEERPNGGGRVGLLAGQESNPEIISARKKSPAQNGRIYGKVKLKNGNLAVEVFHVFALRLSGVGEFSVCEPIVLKVKGSSLTGLAELSNRLRTVTVAGLKLDTFNYQIRVTGAMTKNQKGQQYAIFKFEGAVDNDLSLSLVAPKVDGEENPIRIAGREFVKKLSEHGDKLLEVMSNPPPNRSEDEETSEAIA